jgi:RNA polymerase sigma-70 factor, ECF subfamily
MQRSSWASRIRVKSVENRIAPALVYADTMRAAVLVLTHELGEIDLTGPRTDAELLILASARAGVDRRYRLAGLLLGNAADAEDATQEAMLRAWRSAASLRDVSRVDAWLDGILVNVCRDRMRRRKLVRFIVLDDGATGPALDPFQAVVDRDEVARAMRGLDADQRIVVVLHYWGGVTLEGVADRLGWPLGTVKSRLHRALQQMRASLDGAGATPEGAG